MGKKKQKKAESGKAGGKRQEVRLAGFGGQGIVLSGNILGKAVSLYEGRNAVFTQNYGPEARGGACSADVVISGDVIYYPKVTRPDVMVFMSEEARVTYGSMMRPDTIVIVDEDLVRRQELEETIPHLYSIPATRFAEELGRKMVANIVMLGYLAAVTDVVHHESLKSAALASVPKGTEDLNTRAFEKGYEYGENIKGGHE